ncbi:MAG: hypothetical protein LBK66_06900 [Spirochaetaceae bacterium]|jgi:hypothetical protein|nr:hypothetical protein [Spirochaetaceae bacterium]
MIKLIKVLKTNFVFAIVSAALIFTACENDFMQKALSTLSGGFGGGGGIIPAPITWNTNVVYSDPIGGTLSGTLMALLNNGGNRIWFAHEQNNKASKQWEFDVGKNTITAGSLAAFIAGSPTVSNGDLMTLNFYEPDFTSITSFSTGDGTIERYSFILYPDSLYGADRDSIAIETATLNFRVEAATYTKYAQYVIEKEEYGSISVSWAEGSNSITTGIETEIKAEMQRLAGSLAAEKGSAAAVAWAKDAWANFDPISDGSVGSLSAVSWITSPDLSKGWLPYAKYAIGLSSILYQNDTEQQRQSPRISVPVEFTSYVGSAAILIKEAGKAGQFGATGSEIYAGSVAEVLTSLGVPSLLEDGDAGTTIVWSPGVGTPEPTDGGEHPFSVILGKGKDTSPGDTVVELKAIF